MNEPKVLIWDLETGGVNALRSDLGMMLCFGYKWLGEKQTYCPTVDEFPGWFDGGRGRKGRGVNDKPLLLHALKIMEQADLLVAHYGDKFDRRFFQGRCAIHNLMPPPPTKQRDTLRIARRAFNFSSNRLGALALTLELTEEKHQKTRDEWPGWWLRAMAGDRQAIHEMAKYCKQDVRTLEQVYLRLRPYDWEHPRLFADRSLCRMCGGPVCYKGKAYVGENFYKRFVCLKCGKWDRDRKAMEVT